MALGNGRGDPEALRDGIRQTRAELGETLAALAAKADVGARLKESAAQTGGRLRQQAAQTGGRLRQQAAQTTRLVRSRAGRNLVPAAAVALGVVAAVVTVVVLRGRRR
jgi:preprotein translocase subunit SecF